MTQPRYEPSSHLVEPQASDPTPSGGYIDISEAFTILSPSHWARELIKELTGFDIFDEIGKYFAGDWEAFSKAGHAIKNVSDAMPELGWNIHFGNEQMHAGWTGNAADSAWGYFANAAKLTMDQQDNLRRVAEAYEKTATAIWGLAGDVASLLEWACDSFIVAAAASAVGTALIETGVGAAAGYGVAALKIAEGLEFVSKAMLKIQIGWTAIQPVFQLMKAGEQQLQPMTGLDAPYYTPPPGFPAEGVPPK